MKEGNHARTQEQQDYELSLSALKSSLTVTQLQNTLRSLEVPENVFLTSLTDPQIGVRIIKGYEQKQIAPFSLAVLLSQYGFEEVGDFINTNFEDNQLSVELFARSWFNCTSSESYFNEALSKKRLLPINNGRLVIKPIGEMTALCIDTFSTTRATFIEGVWYSPIDRSIRNNIRDSFDKDLPHVSIPEGSWLPIRSAYTAEGLLEKTKIALPIR